MIKVQACASTGTAKQAREKAGILAAGMPRFAGKVISDKTKLNFIQGFLSLQPWVLTFRLGRVRLVRVQLWVFTFQLGRVREVRVQQWVFTFQLG